MSYSWLTPRQRLVRAAEAAESQATYQVRRKCFLSYAGADLDEVETFVDTYGAAFIPRVIGVSEDDPFIDSDDDDYVLSSIQQKYMWDSSVTIVLIGACTWSRRFVDWEIYSSLRDDSKNKRNGLMALQLPSVDGGKPTLPQRLSDNLRKDGADAYARYYRYPSSETELRSLIEDAFSARTSRAHLIAPAEPRRRRNSPCSQ